ncbi:hypothetical protein ACPCSE_29410 [Streptomyces cellulosae]
MSTDTQARITAILDDAQIPVMESVDDDDAVLGFRVSRTGYLISVVNGPNASVSIVGRDGLPESARQAECDGLIQQARAALAAAGCDVRVNEYGTIVATVPKAKAQAS